MKRFIHVHETFVPWVKRGGEGGDEREVPGGGKENIPCPREYCKASNSGIVKFYGTTTREKKMYSHTCIIPPYKKYKYFIHVLNSYMYIISSIQFTVQL